jgi:hypothetical protein
MIRSLVNQDPDICCGVKLLYGLAGVLVYISVIFVFG